MTPIDIRRTQMAHGCTAATTRVFVQNFVAVRRAFAEKIANRRRLYDDWQSIIY